MAKVSKTVLVSAEVEIEFDDSLVPDDEWRSVFYHSIKDESDLAKHFAYNHVINSARLSQLDGFADREDGELKAIMIDIETECL